MVQPYGREFGKLHMHFPFYTEISFQEIYSKILWQKSRNTHTQVYLVAVVFAILNSALCIQFIIHQ